MVQPTTQLTYPKPSSWSAPKPPSDEPVSSETPTSKNVCTVCDNVILIMCRVNTGICSENCEKKVREADRELPASEL